MNSDLSLLKGRVENLEKSKVNNPVIHTCLLVLERRPTACSSKNTCIQFSLNTTAVQQNGFFLSTSYAVASDNIGRRGHQYKHTNCHHHTAQADRWSKYHY